MSGEPQPLEQPVVEEITQTSSPVEEGVSDQLLHVAKREVRAAKSHELDEVPLEDDNDDVHEDEDHKGLQVDSEDKINEALPPLPTHPPKLPDRTSAELRRTTIDLTDYQLSSQMTMNYANEENEKNDFSEGGNNQSGVKELLDIKQFLMMRKSKLLDDLIKSLSSSEEGSILRSDEEYLQRISEISNDGLHLQKQYNNGTLSTATLNYYLEDPERQYLMYCIATRSEYFKTDDLPLGEETPELMDALNKLNIEKSNQGLLKLITYNKSKVPTPLIIKISDYLATLFPEKDITNILISINHTFDKIFNTDEKCTNEFSNSFYFLLLRTLENKDPKELIKLSKDKDSSAIKYFNEKFQQDEFWQSLLNKLSQDTELELINKFIEIIILFEFAGIINTIISVLYDDNKTLSIDISNSLISFDVEYQILSANKTMELYEDDVELNKFKNRRFKLTKDLEHKRGKYQELKTKIDESSIIQLKNSEKLQELRKINQDLKNEVELKNKKIDELVSNFEVININNNKNQQIKLINDELKEEIDDLLKQINEMKSKLKK